jgi:predicted RecA/RadA family phage recombinase
MATNQTKPDSWIQAVACSNPTTPASGDPVRYGYLTGVAITDERTAGDTTVDFGPKEWDLSVKGVDDSGNSAVAVGDVIYYVDADTPKLSKKSTGYLFGIAMETVGSGSTDTIRVLKLVSPGGGSLGTGTVTATNLGTGSVTAVKLSATLKTGFIPLDISNAVILSSNAVQNTTEGGRPDGNTTPILARVNGATDIAFVLTWAATVVTEIQWSVPLPPDLDDAGAIVMHLWLEKDANTDTAAVVAVKLFQGKGDSNAGGNTGALSSATGAEYTVTMAAGDVLAQSAAPFLNVALVPGTHANDAVRCYAAWLTYTRA